MTRLAVGGVLSFMKLSLQLSRTSVGYAAVAIGLVISLWLGFAADAFAAEPHPASGQRLITIYDDGREKSLITSTDTLREAFDEANIYIDPSDAVEPGLDEQLIASSYEVNIYRAVPVTIVDGAIRQKVLSPYRTSKQIAQHAHITLQDEDTSELEQTEGILREGTGMRMTITRATPFTLVLYGTKTVAYTQAKTVGEMLDQKGVTIAADDTLSVDKTAPIQKDMTIELWRNGVQTATAEEAIAFQTERIQDADREISYRQIKTPGQPGKKTVTYEIEMKNGQEVRRTAIQSVTTKEPVKQVEIVGAKPSFSGDFAAALATLRTCESGGNYANKNNPLYRGAYQFSYSTWANKYGIYDPADASPAQQDQAARELYVRRGWQPWPHCGASLPDSYR